MTDTNKSLKCAVKYNGNDTSLPHLALESGIEFNQNSLQSMCFHNVCLSGKYMEIAQSLVMKLVTSSFNTPDGIIITADMPYSRNCNLNIC